MSVNTISAEPPSALPTLADIQRRRAELLAWQGRPQPAQKTNPAPAVPPASPVPPMGPPCNAPAWPSLSEAALRALAEGGYLARAEPVLLIGEPGTGKSHLATGLAIAACKQRKRVALPLPPPWLTS